MSLVKTLRCFDVEVLDFSVIVLCVFLFFCCYDGVSLNKFEM